MLNQPLCKDAQPDRRASDAVADRRLGVSVGGICHAMKRAMLLLSHGMTTGAREKKEVATLREALFTGRHCGCMSGIAGARGLVSPCY
jgi:hypothetical protein